VKCWRQTDADWIEARGGTSEFVRNLIVGSSPRICRQPTGPSIAIMSQFRATKLDIGCFAKIRNIRDHTKRKVYSENEPERYAPPHLHIALQGLTTVQTSPTIHHPQHHAPTTSPRASSAPAFTDALLHTVHTGQEQVHNGRQGPWCLQRLQDGTSRHL
jgi:hypothetical protein